MFTRRRIIMNNEPNPPDSRATPTPVETTVAPAAATAPDSTKPSTTTGTVSPTTLPVGGSSLSRPPKPGAPRPGGASRPFLRGEKQPQKGDKSFSSGGAPAQPVLRDFGAHKPNNRELDKLIEEELNQSMV